MAATQQTGAVLEHQNEKHATTYALDAERSARQSDDNLDKAYWYVHQSENAKDEEATPRQLKALRRKIDWRIVPIMFLCYTMQFIDKVSLNVCTKLHTVNALFDSH